METKSATDRAQSGPYERLSTAFSQPGSGVTTSVDVLDSVLSVFHHANGWASQFSDQDVRDLGLSTLRNEGAPDLRAAALEAQARRIEDGTDIGDQALARRLRDMGPSAEAVAYGYDQTGRRDGFGASTDRVLVESTHVALTSSPGADRSAYMSLQEANVRWEGQANTLSLQQRQDEARAFFSEMSDADLIKATRATQASVCEEILLGDDQPRHSRVKALAATHVIASADAGALLKTQKEIDSLYEQAGAEPISRSHPLSILSVASNSVLRDREAERLKAKESAPRQEER